MSHNKNTKKNKSSRQKGGRFVAKPDRIRDKRNDKTTGMPGREPTKLQFTHVSVQMVSAASFLKSFNPNTYIPENSGTLAPAQYVEWAAFYDQYRVTRFKVDVEITNRDTTEDVNVYLALTNETLSGGLFSDISTNPYSRSHTLTKLGGGFCKKRMVMGKTVTALTANQGAPYADSFHAVINANPTDVVWATVGGATTSGTNSTLGVSILVKVTMWIQFFSMNFTTMQVPPTPEMEQFRAEAYRLFSETKNVQYILNYIHFSKHKNEAGKCSCPCKNTYSVYFHPTKTDLRLLGPIKSNG